MSIKKLEKEIEQLLKDMKEFHKTGKIERIHKNHKEDK